MQIITQDITKQILDIPLPKAGRYNRLWMSILLVVTDLIGLGGSAFLALGVRLLWMHEWFSLSFYMNLLPLLLAFIIVYAIYGLYPSVGLNPVEEMRRLVFSTTATFFMLVVVSFWGHIADNFSRLVLSLFWVFGLFAVPFLRWLVRRVAIRTHAWGEPVAIVGCGPQTRKIVEFLSANPTLGLVPKVVVNGFNQTEEVIGDTPVLESKRLRENPGLLSEYNIHTAVMVPDETPLDFQSLIVDERRFGFQRLVLISNLGWMAGSAVIPYDFQGILGLEVQRKLLNKGEQFIKRLMDLILIFLGGIFALPLIGMIALLIRLEAPGTIFYCHKRVGRDGKNIRVWKFRTMAMDAEQLLERCLCENPELRVEWEANHKLKNDPRVTRVGAILRRTSLDELPQLWNVIIGEMSLVGPRPIVSDEIIHYHETFRLYKQVLPGMTGLWQVSGRNDTSYESRVRLDEYYIRRWSIWMDIYVLIRTVWVVVKQSGAY